MSVAVLAGDDARLPARAAALAGFAVALTEAPWSLTPAAVERMAEHGFGAAAIEAATCVVGMFNYLTRVADATGIPFDFPTPLPEFRPDRDRQPAARPDRACWPAVHDEFRSFPRFPALTETWARWRGYVFESDAPLRRAERRLLARTAAEECCDRSRVDSLGDAAPAAGARARLVDFARKLSRVPWRMEAADLDTLRAAGYSEVAILHAIAVVALQNADSRVALGRALVDGRR